MTDEPVWYVLDFNEGARVVMGAGAVGIDSFSGPLSTRDGQRRYSLRLWRAPERPDELTDVERARARGRCVLAIGGAEQLVVELRAHGTRYQVGRPERGTATRTIRFDLGHQATVYDSEVFDSKAVAELFLAYFRAGVLLEADYLLRELDMPDPLDGAPTHGLTVDFDTHRPVQPTVQAGEFAAFLAGLDSDEASVLVLWPFSPGGTMAGLTDEQLSNHQEFIQTAGSAGRYTAEIRRRTGDTYTQYTIGRQVDYLVWGSETTTIEAEFASFEVYRNEVFTPTQVGTLFHHYVRNGDIPASGYLVREISTE